jgi:quercetin dioxygenase-like cupin family protein
MVRLIDNPARIPVPGGKLIDEYVGRVASDSDEVTLVLSGSVVVKHHGGRTEVHAGQAVLTHAGERVRYSAGPDGADYVAVCVPAFAPELAHRGE